MDKRRAIEQEDFDRQLAEAMPMGKEMSAREAANLIGPHIATHSATSAMARLIERGIVVQTYVKGNRKVADLFKKVADPKPPRRTLPAYRQYVVKTTTTHGQREGLDTVTLPRYPWPEDSNVHA